MKALIEKLITNNKTISTMESCTGGYVANSITNTEGASEVFKFGAVTYSNEHKIKMGVSEKIIDEFSVYSMETANEMSKSIVKYTCSDYGIGITGKLNREDKNNKNGENNVVYISIYDKEYDKFYNQTLTLALMERCRCKEMIMKIIIEMLNNIIKQEEIWKYIIH